LSGLATAEMASGGVATACGRVQPAEDVTSQ